MQTRIDILTASEARQKYVPCQSEGQYTKFETYIQGLTQKGITINPKLFLAKFHLKNGLPFTGWATRDEIKGGEVLFRVPFDLIFSSEKARSQPQLSEILQDQFFKGGQQSGEMRILTVYSLFLLYKKDESNLWYQMVSQFPKQCDIVCFWPETELSKFNDPTVKKGAKDNLMEFEHEWTQFEVLRNKHQLLQNAEFDKLNYQNMFLTAVSRTFYSILKYVSHGPVAEFINHHAVKVYYDIEKEKETYLIDEKENESETSSLGSCECIEVFQEGQFDYQANSYQQKQLSELQKEEKNHQENQIIAKTTKEITDSLTNQLDWTDFTVIFAGKIMEFLNTLQQECSKGEKTLQKAMEELSLLKVVIEDYKKRIREYYAVIKLKEYLKKEQPKLKHEQYSSLILKTTKFDHFKPNNQIYLRYGPNCNRTLLLTYGLSIQGNKYEHFTISLKIADYLKNCPQVFIQTAQRKLSLFRKFNIHSHRVNIDLIVFFRLCQWIPLNQNLENIFKVTNRPRQISILEQILSMFKERLAAFDDKYDLTNQQLNYHQYFVSVYNQQKSLLLKKQIHLFTLLRDILNKTNKGNSLQEAALHLTQSERSVLNPYLRTLKFDFS